MHFLHEYAEKSVMHLPYHPVYHLWFVIFVTRFLVIYIQYTLAAVFYHGKNCHILLVRYLPFHSYLFPSLPANGSDAR